MEAVGTVEKAIEVLFHLHRESAAQGVTSIGRSLGLPKSSAHRLLSALSRRGLVEKDEFGRYLGFGIATLFALQILLNLAVVMGMMPTKGLPLPFVSYGGSAIVMSLFMTGILLNIGRHAGAAPPGRG